MKRSAVIAFLVGTSLSGCGIVTEGEGVDFESTGGSDHREGEGKGALGAPCISSLHELTTFQGYTSDSASPSSSNTCASEICLVNHVQGRIECPYGSENASETGDCSTAQGKLIELPVWPQYEGRRLDDHMYCSCRCDGPEADEQYCSCPEGMECEKLIDRPTPIDGLGDLAGESLYPDPEWVGSYCIRAGTAYSELAGLGRECSRELMNCDL